jgi:hypothetical protein
MEEFDQNSLFPLIKYPKTDVSRPEIEPGGHSTKELASQIYINLNIRDLYFTFPPKLRFFCLLLCEGTFT